MSQVLLIDTVDLPASGGVAFQIVAMAAMLLLLLFAACFDLAYRTIPNWVCGTLVVVGLASRVAVGFGAVALSTMTAAVVFVALAFAHARGVLGGGDIKLVSAVTLGLSAPGAYHLLIGTAFAGGVIGILYLVLRQLPRPQLGPPGMSHIRRLWIVERWRWRRKNCLPYGVAIALGGSWALLSGPGM
jgi:prepilin peptidase CpaA